jgi:tetratricopeptide (TPR) repeat protein
VRIPEGVREVIGRRLNRLSQRCNQTLTIASVIGREFTLEQLKSLIEDMTEDRLLEVLEVALAARVIEELPRAVGRYQFTHALIQETLLEELTTTRRVRLHARIAAALEELYGANAEAHAAELAHHFAEAQTVLGPERLVRYSLLAGERALAAYAWEEAQAHFQRALAAKEGQPHVGQGLALPSGSQGAASSAPTGPAVDEETAEILVGLGHAQSALTDQGEKAEAYANLERAFDFFVETGDLDRAIAVAADPNFHIESPVAARALQLAPPDSHTAGRLLCNYGVVQYHMTGDYEVAQEALSRALAIAQRHGDRDLEMRTLSNAAHVATDHYQWPEALEKALGAIQLAREEEAPGGMEYAHEAACHSLRAKGDFQGAHRHAEVLLALAEKLRTRGSLRNALGVSIEASFSRGDWPAVRALCDRHENRETLIHQVRLEYEVGDFGQGQAWLERLLESGQGASPGSHIRVFCALGVLQVARIADVADRFGTAEALARGVLSSPRRIPRFTMLARTALALMAVQRGQAEAAAEQYAVLEPLKGTVLPHSLIIMDRVLGLTSQIMGNLDQAMAHFENALAFCRRAGYRPELAWSCCDYADCLLARAKHVGAGLALPSGAQQAAPLQEASARGEPVETRASPDYRKAMSLLDEALAISRDLGMRPLMERVLSRRQILTA